MNVNEREISTPEERRCIFTPTRGQQINPPRDPIKGTSMIDTATVHPSRSKTHISTETFAIALSCSPATIRKRYSTTGTYFGVRPQKLPNRRLLWPYNAVDLLLTANTHT